MREDVPADRNRRLATEQREQVERRREESGAAIGVRSISEILVEAEDTEHRSDQGVSIADVPDLEAVRCIDGEEQRGEPADKVAHGPAIQARDYQQKRAEPEQAVRVHEERAARPQPYVEEMGREAERAEERQPQVLVRPPRSPALLYLPVGVCRNAVGEAVATCVDAI